jgi:hypothetical protein
MATTKLSDLTAATSLTDSDILHLRTVGAIDKKITWQNLKLSLGTIKVVSDANYTILDNDGFRAFFFDLLVTSRTLTLPTASANAGRMAYVKLRTVTNAGSAVTLTIDGEGTETIDGLLTHVLLKEGDWVVLFCDGFNWHIKARSEVALLKKIGLMATRELHLESLAQNNTMNGGAWSPSLHRFAVVSQDGTNRCQTSEDGVNWTVRSMPGTTVWYGVCWSAEKNLFVAATSDGTWCCATSPDGITWTGRNQPTTWSNWQRVAYSPKLDLFCMVSFNGLCCTSPDGITWTNRTLAAADQMKGLLWVGDGIDLFVACSDSGTSGRVQTSPDGINWTKRSTDGDDWSDIAYSPELHLIVVSGGDTGFPPSMTTSPDGITWTTRVPPGAANVKYISIEWSPEYGLFLAAPNSAVAGADWVVSEDGINWYERGNPQGSTSWRVMMWAPELMAFVCVAIDGASRVALSR